MTASTVSAILSRIGIGKLGRVWSRSSGTNGLGPGEPIHVDVKSWGGSSAPPERGSSEWQTAESRPKRRDAAGVDRQVAGWEMSTSRSMTAPAWPTRRFYATTKPPPSSPPQASGQVLRPARSHSRAGTGRQRLVTYTPRSTPSPAAPSASATSDPALQTPNHGKAERFIRTLTAGWAYGAAYRNSTERAAALGGWLWYYNHRRNTQPSVTSPRSLASASESTFLGLTIGRRLITAMALA